MHRSQLSPISVVVLDPQVESPFEPSVSSLEKWQDVRFFRCRLVYESGPNYNLRPVLAPNRVKWSSILGIGLAALVSAGIWAGIVWTAVQFWK